MGLKGDGIGFQQKTDSWTRDKGSGMDGMRKGEGTDGTREVRVNKRDGWGGERERDQREREFSPSEEEALFVCCVWQAI